MKSKKIRKDKIVTRKLNNLPRGKRSVKFRQLGGKGLTNNNRRALIRNVSSAEGVKYTSPLNTLANKSFSGAKQLIPKGYTGMHSPGLGMLAGDGEGAGMVAAVIIGIHAAIITPPLVLGTIGLTSKLLSGIWKKATFKNIKDGFNVKVIRKEIIDKLIETGKLPPNFKSLSSKERAEAEANINLDLLVNDTVEYYKKVEEEAKILGKEKLEEIARQKEAAKRAKHNEKYLKKHGPEKLKQFQKEREEKEKAKQLKIEQEAQRKEQKAQRKEEQKRLKEEEKQRRKNAGETTVIGRMELSADDDYEALKKGVKSVASDTMGDSKRKLASFKTGASNYMKRLKGETADTCSLIKDKTGPERYNGREQYIDVQTNRSLFFKEEDSYFKSIVSKNMKNFCFNTKVANDQEYYSRFCRNVLQCMKKPNSINSLVFEAVDYKAIKRMFDSLPGSYNPQDNLEAIGDGDPGSNLKKRIAKRILEENKEIQQEQDPKQRFAMILSVLQNENKRSLATFLVDVLIKSIIEYREAANSPPKSYTGEIKLQSHVEKIIKKLTKKYDTENKKNNSNNEGGENNNEDGNETGKNKNQSGGSNEGDLMTPAQLKKIGVEELYDGLMHCTTKDIIKAEHDADKDNKDLFEDEEFEIDNVAEGLESPKLLYIVVGSLALVSLIELGLFDAPECLTHTFI